jgi:GNAT superfamily N-acetyltransferase
MKIEHMKFEDLEGVLPLVAQLGYPCTFQDLQSRFKDFDGTKDYALFVAKDEAGEILGYIQINRESYTLLADTRADIGGLVVNEKARGQKVGEQLLKTAEAWAQENKIPLVRVRSNIKRIDAHRFYQRHGYVLNKTGHIFTKSL